MGVGLNLAAKDGFRLGAYRADPSGTAKGGVVVIQEIFGVNHHIRAVCDRLAGEGYRALAPSVFDRFAPGFQSGYSEADVAAAMALIPKLDWEKLMLDTNAAIDELKKEGPTAIMGFCLGGTVSFLAATQPNGLKAAVCYYGGFIAKHADKKPFCPVQMHFGEKDGHIPLSDVEAIKQKRPEAEIYVYEGAGHGFHCDERGSYEPKSAKIAWERSMAFLKKAFGK
jgi:carboxymethylenebutenolidase